MLTWAVVLATLAFAAFGSVCNDLASQNCDSCTNATTLGIHCRWCPVDSTCHTVASTDNPCKSYDNIANNEYCQCKCAEPAAGFNATICGWYTQVHETLPSDPADWYGGDFLPAAYQQTGTCICSGCGTNGQCDAIWTEVQPKVIECIRGYIIRGTIALPDSTKQTLRTNGVLVGSSIIHALYDIHTNAWEQCCCVGGFVSYSVWFTGWWGASALLPCTGLGSTIQGLLDFARCGCGM